MVKYSFIVPVYNCEAYLKECVESILCQSGDYSLEVILVDDGAQDRSGQIADELAEKHPQVCTFHKENGGAASARNYGMEKAVGEYLLFIDGDDTVDASLLETVDSHLETSQQPLIIYGMSFDYYKGENLQRTEKLSCRHDGGFSVRAVLEDFSQFFWDNALSSACNKVFSAEVIRRNGLCFLEGMTLYEDLDFVLRYLGYIENIHCVAQPFYHYRHDLGKPHLNTRVQNLSGVRQNLSRLLTTAARLTGSCSPAGAREIKNTMANLYMQLLSQNLMVSKYSLPEMEEKLMYYCGEEVFRALLRSGAELSEKERTLLSQIDAGQFGAIQREYQKRKLISKGKRLAKKLIRKQ